MWVRPQVSNVKQLDTEVFSVCREVMGVFGAGEANFNCRLWQPQVKLLSHGNSFVSVKFSWKFVFFNQSWTPICVALSHDSSLIMFMSSDQTCFETTAVGAVTQ